MTTIAITRHRPASVLAIIAVLFFLGITAVGGGLALLMGYTPPQDWLDGVPLITNWVVPGLVLGMIFGLGSLVTAYGVLARHRWSWAATVLIGLGHMVWIGLELLFLPAASALQLIYGPVGLALAGLPFLPSVSQYLRLWR